MILPHTPLQIQSFSHLSSSWPRCWVTLGFMQGAKAHHGIRMGCIWFIAQDKTCNLCISCFHNCWEVKNKTRMDYKINCSMICSEVTLDFLTVWVWRTKIRETSTKWLFSFQAPLTANKQFIFSPIVTVAGIKDVFACFWRGKYELNGLNWVLVWA